MWSLSDALVEIVDGDGNPMETQYYNPGSEIELTCIIRNRSHWSTKTIWMKDQQPLDLFHRPTVRLVKAQKSLLISFLRKDAVCGSLMEKLWAQKPRALFLHSHFVWRWEINASISANTPDFKTKGNDFLAKMRIFRMIFQDRACTP